MNIPLPSIDPQLMLVADVRHKAGIASPRAALEGLNHRYCPSEQDWFYTYLAVNYHNILETCYNDLKS